jgi:hypothetical protein
LANLVNIGTLFAFILVAIGVIILRHTRPDLERSFRTPPVPLVPILSVLASCYLMLKLTTATWVRFFVWMAVGLVIYAVYGARHSRLAAEGPQDIGRGQGVISLDARDQTSAGQRRWGGAAAVPFLVVPVVAEEATFFDELSDLRRHHRLPHLVTARDALQDIAAEDG